jgi:hypothetical protein
MGHGGEEQPGIPKVPLRCWNDQHDFKIKELLTKGSYGKVYLAAHQNTGRDLIVKVLPAKMLSICGRRARCVRLDWTGAHMLITCMIWRVCERVSHAVAGPLTRPQLFLLSPDDELRHAPSAAGIHVVTCTGKILCFR